MLTAQYGADAMTRMFMSTSRYHWYRDARTTGKKRRKCELSTRQHTKPGGVYDTWWAAQRDRFQAWTADDDQDDDRPSNDRNLERLLARNGVDGGGDRLRSLRFTAAGAALRA